MVKRDAKKAQNEAKRGKQREEKANKIREEDEKMRKEIKVNVKRNLTKKAKFNADATTLIEFYLDEPAAKVVRPSPRLSRQEIAGSGSTGGKPMVRRRIFTGRVANVMNNDNVMETSSFLLLPFLSNMSSPRSSRMFTFSPSQPLASILRTTIEIIRSRSPSPEEQHVLAMKEVDAVINRMEALPEGSRIELRKRIDDANRPGGEIGIR